MVGIDPQQLISGLDAMPWWLIFKTGIVFVCLLTLKQLIDNVVSYIMFVTNKDFNKNVKVIVNGKKGIIMDYNIRNIFIKVEGGNTMIIPITRWKLQQWEVVDSMLELYMGDKEE